MLFRTTLYYVVRNTLRKKHSEWIKLNIYEDVYKNFLNKFLKKNTKTKEFKYQSIDSTFEKIKAKLLLFEKANYNKLCLL